MSFPDVCSRVMLGAAYLTTQCILYLLCHDAHMLCLYFLKCSGRSPVLQPQSTEAQYMEEKY